MPSSAALISPTGAPDSSAKVLMPFLFSASAILALMPVTWVRSFEGLSLAGGAGGTVPAGDGFTPAALSAASLISKGIFAGGTPGPVGAFAVRGAVPLSRVHPLRVSPFSFLLRQRFYTFNDTLSRRITSPWLFVL